MAKYRNKITGVVIDSPFTISGDPWEQVGDEVNEQPGENAESPVDDAPTVVEQQVEDDNDELSGITVAEIKQELDALGIEYSPKAKKQELFDLMTEGR